MRKSEGVTLKTAQRTLNLPPDYHELIMRKGGSLARDAELRPRATANKIMRAIGGKGEH